MGSAVYIGNVPEVFRIADKLTEKERMAERSKIVTRKPRIVPMPTIDSNPNVQGPLYVTEQFRENFRKEKAIEKKKEKREYEKELLECLGKKERLQYKLSKLDRRKKKDCKKAIAIEFQLRDLDEKIEDLQKESGIVLDKQDSQSKLGKIWGRVKSVISKAIKKVKRFFKKHTDAIEGVLMVVLPIIGTAIFRRLLGL